ncbi:MAG TPA: fatty acid synthase subunit beta domain-containing protein [Aeromicrobium sp.]|nr:fatty acid synthase subunit beta domain-containing protein [Aeromicrobium sp.]
MTLTPHRPPVSATTAAHPASGGRLLDRLAAGTPFGIVFGGQGEAAWLEHLADLLRRHDVELAPLLAAVDERLAPVADELRRTGTRFDPLVWADRIAAGESAVDEDWPAPPSADALLMPSVAIPGVTFCQVAGLRALLSLGLDPAGAVAVAGHSQGVLAAAAVEDLPDVEVIAIARLAGVAVEQVARRQGLLGATMLSVAGPTTEEVAATLRDLPDSARVVANVRNGRRSTVLSGPADGIARAAELFEETATTEPVAARAAFHHPDLDQAADLVAAWAEQCDLDPARAAELTRASIIAPVDWVDSVDGLVQAGARWLVDLGPGDLATRLSLPEATAYGLGVVAPTTRRGFRDLTVTGNAPRPHQAWSAFRPTVVTLPDGSTRVETKFTRLTGRSPILLAGMTPTTVDPQIVAAAANAGFWAELAGGGQVTEPIFAANVERLDALLDDGRTYAFNSLFLDPYLWRLQIGGRKLVQRARSAGSAVDAVVVTAGIPDLDDAVELTEDLRAAGIEYIAFKPGTVEQIRQVLAIADALAPLEVIVQIEGGKAGGHHSDEDLDRLLIEMYGKLRQRDNIVVCVGGGIGTPEDAVRYLTGSWSVDLGFPAMPLDGVLIGTAAMATLEATTSPSVKQLLVQTTSDHVISGRSQLGASIHEIDNAASRTGRLLDEVAGDAEAVVDRRDEIIDALNRTAKPYIGDVAAMTYGQLLDRFAALASTGAGWLDVSLRDRFHELVQRAEARLHPADEGSIPTLFEVAADVEHAAAALTQLRAAYPSVDDVILHPTDVHFFIDVCRRPGKPVPFVPVIDADVRQWWRSDSLWQAHDPRFDADAVCVIPGPASVDGITQADEPVADLLRRFESAVVAAVDSPSAGVDGLRRSDGLVGPVSLALAAPDVDWDSRIVRNPVKALGTDWIVVNPERVEHPETGASLVALSDTAAGLAVPVGKSTLRFTLRIDAAVAAGAAPVIEDADVTLGALLEVMAGGHVASEPVRWSPNLIADHAAVTTVESFRAVAVPDVLVGLTWPAVFAALGERPDVVSGILDLVHLDHSITGNVPDDSTELAVSAEVREVADTEFGRVVTVDVTMTDEDTVVATLVERFALRGRPGDAELATPQVAGGATDAIRETPRRRRAHNTVVAPTDLRPFAAVSGDHNPIHTSLAAARLAGLGSPIVHGMWLSAVAQRAVSEATGRTVTGWTARFLAPVRPGDAVDITADRIGVVNGDEVVDVAARVDGEVVLTATARLAPPRTAYVFPGQGIQSRGMGMEGYARSRAAREIWDRADAHTREHLGFSILEVVRDNPTELRVRAPGEDGAATFRHPDGVLFLTQFTQVAMAVLASAQVAELRESGAFVEGALTAGHSVGEYNALAAVTGTLSLEAVVEVVFQRGTVMHELVPRDAEGRSDYRLAAIRPSQIGLDDDDVRDFVATIAFETGEFLEVANENLRGSQYVIAGTVRGCEALEAEVERRRAEAGGRGAFILVPGIDVPFHSRILRGGVDSFRARLEELLPPAIDPGILVRRYVPNLVARTFSLDDDFLRSILDVVPAERIEAVLADRDAWVGREGELCRLVLVELLAWQFASPVRWIETQDLFFASPADTINGEAGLGIERVVEVGVGTAPTLANIASSTVKLPRVARRLAGPVEVLNVERDAAVVFSTDEQPPEDVDDVAVPADVQPEGAPEPAAPAARRASNAEPVADLPFTAADATRLLIAWWTKVRPDQLGAADSIESLCDGASSRRNQLLVDLGAELALGAIDGAAEADLPTLTQTVTGLARGYRPLGPVLSATVADHLKDVLGPTGVRSAAISDRVANHWSLGPGWATHVLTQVALATRDGASARGESLRTAEPPTTSADVDALVDSTVLSLAAERGVAVEPAGSGEALAVDAEALAAVTGGITGALVSSARELLERLGEDTSAAAAARNIETDDDAAEILARVEAELGRDWITATAPAFDAQRAVLLDDRWASAREDVVRIAAGQSWGHLPLAGDKVDFAGAGSSVAEMARWFGLTDIAEAASSEESGAWADDVAVVTGASDGSIAASVVADLLRGGATVVATTSSLDATKLAFFKRLYRSHARVGAALWVVPANMASYQDVDALVEWVGTEQTRSVGPTTQVVKPALRPTLLFPFAAGRVLGDAADAGSRAEVEARILLWSVERLVGARWHGVSETDRLHVVLPGSPNRGLFGGDGAYGETKAALDALVAKSVRESWGRRVTLAHAVIGWVRGTGLMGGNDTLVAAVEAAGVRTWTPDEMAAELLDLSTTSARRKAAERPLHADFAAGLADVDLSGLTPVSPVPEDEPFDGATIDALPPSPADVADPARLPWGEVSLRPEDMVVIVGAGELGPYGSSRTRYQMEIADALSAAGVLEVAWATGLVRWDAAGRTWFDVESGERVSEATIAERYRDAVAERCGIRSYVDDGTMVDHSAPLLSSVFLDRDLTFNVASEAEAKALQAAAPEHTVIAPSGEGDWTVTRRAGTEIRVPLRKPITRTVGGQIPTGFDPTAWGIPGEMVESVDRVALWNLVCTVDAFLSSGFTPAELMQSVHPARVANTQGTGMGGMTSMQSLHIDNLLGKSVPNDLLQEALPNVIAAHVVQSYVGSYGSMIHPVAACATTAVSVEEGVDKIRVGKADVVVAGGFDDLGTEGVVGFASMSATADTEAMRAQGIEDRRFSRANDRRRGGFVESQGGGTLLLARGDVALRMGLPVLGVVAYAGSFGDGIHQSIPAPGLGALAAGLGGTDSLLARSLAEHGVTADDIAVVSKHDTSTAANDPNESDLHERLATALGRDAGNPLLVMSQKSLTGHAKGGAAAFQLVGLCQTLVDGVVPPNRSLDCVDEALARHRRLVWLREPLATGPLKAGLVTSLGFGHVAGLIALLHPEAFLATLDASEREAYEAAARQRRVDGQLRIARVMLGEDGYVKPRGRRLGSAPSGGASADLEAAVLLDAEARLGEDEVYACQ